MRRGCLILVSVLLLIVLFAVPEPHRAAAGPALPEDFVRGSGEVAGVLTDIAIDAVSDPGGANPRGSVSFTLYGQFPLWGEVTCVSVDGNRATVSALMFGTVAARIEVVDDATDSFAAEPVDDDCTNDEQYLSLGGSLTAGDLVVHDSTALDATRQCKKGGWMRYVDRELRPFKNQGRCVAAVAGTRARSTPSSPAPAGRIEVTGQIGDEPVSYFLYLEGDEALADPQEILENQDDFHPIRVEGVETEVEPGSYFIVVVGSAERALVGPGLATVAPDETLVVSCGLVNQRLEACLFE